MNNNTVINKILLWGILLSLLILAAVIPVAAQESMIPDDFDWEIYLQDWENAWYNDWGTTPQPYSHEPIYYEWYGQNGQIEPWQPAPQYNANPGSADYVPSPGYQEQYNGWGDGGWNQNEYNSDQWFYQTWDGFYDDFADWNGDSNLPASAFVNGFNGYAQSYTLDCETRSAIDLAAYFGVNIAHYEFLNRLPRSDDPNEGFVGNYTDPRGKIPPASYGVYQEPVAALLREYGLNAVGVYAYTDDALKRQIAAGRPVMAWVVGNTEIGYSVPYTAASTGRTTYVVPYQHTVVVIGYDDSSVTIQDGALRYTRDWNTFNLSWGTLGNRAIYVN